MAEMTINDIPAATALFKTKNTGFYIFKCNKALTRLFGVDLAGCEFSHVPARFSGLFLQIAKKAREGAARFVYNDPQPKYSVSIGYSEGYYSICVTPLENSDYEIERQIHLALKLISTGVLTADKDGIISFLNPAAQKITGWDGSAVGKNVSEVLHLFQNGSLLAASVFPYDVFERIYGRGHNIFILKNKSGKTAEVELAFQHTGLKNEQCCGIFFLNDAGEKRRNQKEVEYLSYHDKLTGLFNRTYFEKKLIEYDKDTFYPVSIIIGDLNGLRMSNDLFGHRHGDAMLLTIANILSLACRDDDIIARYGGDEFVVLLPSTTLEDTAKICKNILTLCGSKTCEQNVISISLGYSCKESSAGSMSDTLNVAENFMYRNKLLESRSYRSSVISSLKKMLYEKSYETETHAMRLTGLCAEVGKRLKLSQSDLNDLELFSMLHDIGKIGIRDAVLQKPGKLTEDEWKEMRKHSEIGYRIAQAAPELSHVADYILCHHERFDGKGYPQGLKGKNIPLLSRILAVADSYDAMTNDRYYRKAMSKEAAIAEIKRCSGTQFDPEIVKVFVQMLEEKSKEATVTSA